MEQSQTAPHESPQDCPPATALYEKRASGQSRYRYALGRRSDLPKNHHLKPTLP